MGRFLTLLALAGCASPIPGVNADLSMPDLASQSGGFDLAAGDASSTGCMRLGDPDHCGSCTTVCPPGMDSAGTMRTCSSPAAFAVCDIICKGEWYDINGSISDGCEAQDLPLQDSTTTAVVINLPDTALNSSPQSNNTNPSNVVSQVYGDMRNHDVPPILRPNGREDWYRLNVTGGGATDRGVGACLGITNFPSNNTFEVCVSARGATSFLPTTGCMQVTGGASSVCVHQAMAADETGIYYARVRRLSGATYTQNGYALYLEH
jgi:hypothetical protein